MESRGKRKKKEKQRDREKERKRKREKDKTERDRDREIEREKERESVLLTLLLALDVLLGNKIQWPPAGIDPRPTVYWTSIVRLMQRMKRKKTMFGYNIQCPFQLSTSFNFNIHPFVH